MKLRPGEHKCPICGKVFYIEDTSYWAYRYKTRYALKFTCTWSCLEQLKGKEKPRGFYNDVTGTKKARKSNG